MADPNDLLRERRIAWGSGVEDAYQCWVVRFYRHAQNPDLIVFWRVWEAYDSARDVPDAVGPNDDSYELEGETKWDGCSNWKVRNGIMTHACDRQKLAATGMLLARIYDEVADIMAGPGFVGADEFVDAAAIVAGREARHG